MYFDSLKYIDFTSKSNNNTRDWKKRPLIKEKKSFFCSRSVKRWCQIDIWFFKGRHTRLYKNILKVMWFCEIQNLFQFQRNTRNFWWFCTFRINFNLHTGHGVILLPVPAIVYYINTLDIQLCRRGRGVPAILYVGDVFYKTINCNWANLQKFSNPIDFLEKLSNFG